LTDLTESTHLLEKVGTEGWVELMNHILHILESEVYRFGGEVSQFRGDGLVAFFGATSAHEDDPERAVLAALAMQRAFNHHMRERAPLEAAELQLRVGVNTGEVIVASSMERHQWEETAMGIAVAIASRMETAAEPGTVLVSEHTYRLIHAQFNWQPLGEITIKGVSQPIAVYRPLNHKADTDPLSYDEILPEAVPRIGRESEFHLLKQSVEGLFQGRGCIVTLASGKGGGKTFLLHELRQYFAHRDALLAETHGNSAATGENPLEWRRGRCRSYSQRWPYSLWLDLFRDWLEIRTDATREEKSANLRRRAAD
jgi:class 3 adenylate cyclase